MSSSLRFVERGRLVEVCGASTSGKTQVLLTTAALAALDNPDLTVVLVCCTAAQSVVSRLRSLVVALVGRRVDQAERGAGLDTILPRAAALFRAETGAGSQVASGVGASLRDNPTQSMEDEAAACLGQIHVVHMSNAHALLLFLHCLKRGLDLGGEGGETGGEPSTRPPEKTSELAEETAAAGKATSLPSTMGTSVAPLGPATAVAATVSKAPDHAESAAVEALLTASTGHACAAAATVVAHMQRRCDGAGPLLLVVDGLGSALGAATSGSAGHQAGVALLSAVGSALLSLARDSDAAVLVSNNVVTDRSIGSDLGGRDGNAASFGVKPALGVTWAAVPDSRFLVQPQRCHDVPARKPASASASSRLGGHAADGLVEVTALKLRDAVRSLRDALGTCCLIIRVIFYCRVLRIASCTVFHLLSLRVSGLSRVQRYSCAGY